MSIESLGAYSPNTIYGQLTMPFSNKPVTINSHTPYDEEDDDVVLTRNSFYNNNSKMQVSIEEIREMKGLELDDKIVTKVGTEVKEFPPKNTIPSFQLSSYTSGSGVVFEALQNGYTGKTAIVVGKAFEAYQNAAKHNFSDVVKNLVNTNYQVA